jgi:hypothetical protein
LVACESGPVDPDPGSASAPASDTDLVWAVNIGGPAYIALDGTEYGAEVSVSGGRVGAMELVKGSQDPVLYRTFREGDIRVDHPIPDGVYDITFHFAEPLEIGGGESHSISPSRSRSAVESAYSTVLPKSSALSTTLTSWRSEMGRFFPV